MCMYVYVCTCMCTHVCMYIHIYICMCTYTYTHMHLKIVEKKEAMNFKESEKKHIEEFGGRKEKEEM